MPSRLAVSHASWVFATHLISGSRPLAEPPGPLTEASRASWRERRFSGLGQLGAVARAAVGKPRRAAPNNQK